MDYNCTSDYCNYLLDKIMKKINLGISGCMGRMGQQLIKSSKNNKDFNFKALTEYITINKKTNVNYTYKK